MHRFLGYAGARFAVRMSYWICLVILAACRGARSGTGWHSGCFVSPLTMTEREAKARAVKILAKSIYRDLEAQGFDEKQIVSLATELISEVTTKMARGDKAQQVA
jgi:phosphoribosylformimino-5-aminoimidazole carboxamide ribonucleotide (ProFAR) isomerase